MNICIQNQSCLQSQVIVECRLAPDVALVEYAMRFWGVALCGLDPLFARLTKLCRDEHTRTELLEPVQFGWVHVLGVALDMTRWIAYIHSSLFDGAVEAPLAYPVPFRVSPNVESWLDLPESARPKPEYLFPHLGAIVLLLSVAFHSTQRYCVVSYFVC